ncbi:hypothetical protein OS493_014584 [Desmophyllum pertusum]|uniref:Uncharacterized protein n=1 Tax=Desmophyllum pertusum TaxID=174260 RepID=A0A9W9YPT9_9CNID|nr:hypothetical protein OS493_014584 [Desmophyllum pertusum]
MANSKSVAELPESYTEVAPAVLLNKTPSVPETCGPLHGDVSAINHAIKEEFKWLENVNGIIVSASQPIISFHVIGKNFYVSMKTSVFLAECIASLEVEKQVISTYGKQILSTLPRDDTSSLAPCTHEEADTSMLLHVQGAVQQGHEKIRVRTVDTDVLVLAVAVLQQLREHERLELWVAFGTGTHLRYIATHEIFRSLGPQVSKALPVFPRLHWL